MAEAQPATTERGRPQFDRERCKQCGICSHFCPHGAIQAAPGKSPRLVDPDACTACRLCEYLCPEFGIRVHQNGGDPESEEGGGENGGPEGGGT